MTRLKRFISIAAIVAACVPAFAVSITVAPSTGVNGANPTNTIEDAIAQVNAGADVDNTIVLRSTEGAIILPAVANGTLWTINAGKNVTFNAESGQPVVVLSWVSGRYMLVITAGVNANNQTETVTFNGIAFVPQTGLAYANNIGDGFNCAAGKFVFNNCVFSNNNGSNGVASQEGAVAFVDPPTGNNVGDDWIQFNTLNNATMANCTVTGANDDAVLFGGASSPEISTLTLTQGSCIANNGGAGVQIFAQQACCALDGSAGRVLIANNGKRAASNDVGLKFFGDIGCEFSGVKSDIITATNGAWWDFSGVPFIAMTDMRIAFGNSADVAQAGNISVADFDVQPEPAPDPGDQVVILNRVTVHDTLAPVNVDSIYGWEEANTPRQFWTIKDSIFSGAGDSFANMTNSMATGGASPLPTQSFSAVVTAGPDAVGNVGDLAGAAVSADPVYVTQTYTIGRNQSNPSFLLPSAGGYAAASSTGGLLKGGAPGASAVADWTIY